MEVYIIANIRTNSNKLIGYRLINVKKDGYEVKDVTKQQLLFMLKTTDFKLENAKRSGDKITGIYHSIDILDSLISNVGVQQLFIKNTGMHPVILKKFMHNDKVLGVLMALPDGTVKKYRLEQLERDKQLISSIKNISIENGKLVIKAKQQEAIVELNRMNSIQSEKISDIEAANPGIVWNVKRFMQYMEQHGYEYEFLDANDIPIKRDSVTFNPEDFKVGENLKITLSKIDTRCKIVHVPYGVIHIKSFIDIKDAQIGTNDVYRTQEYDTIIIPSSVYKIGSIARNNEVDLQEYKNKYGAKDTDYRPIRVKNLYFQPGAKNLIDLLGIKNMVIYENLRLPEGKEDKILYISNAFNNCSLPYFPKILTNCKIVFNRCFNDVDFTCDNKINLDKVVTVSASFRCIDTIKKIELGNTITEISDSFLPRDTENDIMPYINLDSTSLESITKSFSHTRADENQLDLDFSKLSKLEEISHSFYRLYNIHSIKLNNNIRRIDHYSFNEVQIDELRLPESIRECTHYIGNGKTKLIYDNCFTKTLSNYLYAHEHMDILKIEDHFTRIEAFGFKNDFNTITDVIGNNIESIGENAFEDASIQKIDYRKLPKVHKIKKETFKSSRLNIAYISSNIEEIEASAFENCKELRKIFISKNVKTIGKRAFFKCGSETTGIIIVYTTKNSEAHRYFKNKENFRVVICNSDEEAAANVILETASENQKNKFKFYLTANNEYSELENEPYLSNCREIMRIYEQFKSEVSPYEGIVDESKLDMNGPSLGSIMPDIEMDLNLCISANNNVEQRYSGKYTKQFAGYVKILTALAENKIGLVKSERAREVYKDNIEIDGRQVIYADNKCQIINTCNNVRTDDRYMILGIIYIIIDKKIVWLAPFNYLEARSAFMDEHSLLYNCSYIYGVPNNNADMTSLLKIGDGMMIDGYSTEKYSLTLNNIELPVSNKYLEIINKLIDYDLRIVACDDFENINLEFNRLKNQDKGDQVKLKSHRFILYSLINNKFYNANIVAEYSRLDNGNSEDIRYYRDVIKMKNIKALRITDIAEFNDGFNKGVGKLTLDKLKDAFSDIVMLGMIDRLSLTEQSMTYYFNKIDAYYKTSDKYDENMLYELASILKKYNLKTIDKLNKKQALAVLNSGMCLKLNKLEKYYKKHFENNVDNLDMRKLTDDSMLISVKVPGDSFNKPQNTVYLYAVMEDGDITSNIDTYLSYFSIESLMDNILTMDKPLENEALHGIVNKPINTDDFTFIESCVANDSWREMAVLDIAVQHCTCEWFILANSDDIDYYTIFRFRTLEEADSFLNDMFGIKSSRSEHVTAFRRYAGYILTLIKKYNALTDELEKQRMEKTNDLWKIRQCIISGYPEGLKLDNNLSDILYRLPKQPGELTLKYKK